MTYRVGQEQAGQRSHTVGCCRSEGVDTVVSSRGRRRRSKRQGDDEAVTSTLPRQVRSINEQVGGRTGEARTWPSPIRSSPFPSAQLHALATLPRRLRERARGNQKLAPLLGPAGGSDVTDTTVQAPSAPFPSFHAIPPPLPSLSGSGGLENGETSWRRPNPNRDGSGSHPVCQSASPANRCNSKSVRMPPSPPTRPSHSPARLPAPLSLPSNNVPTCSSLPHLRGRHSRILS